MVSRALMNAPKFVPVNDDVWNKAFYDRVKATEADIQVRTCMAKKT